MKTIPAVNCKNFECVKKSVAELSGFLPKGSWVQIDVSDGKFTRVKSWNNPKELKAWLKKEKIKKFNYEIHLMVRDSVKEAKKWLSFGANRIIFHVEGLTEKQYEFFMKLPASKTGFSAAPETDIKEASLFLNCFNFIQLLAVAPGYSGRKFNRAVLGKIKFIKKHYPGAVIEIDGGMNPQTAKLAKKAGAGIIVAGSYVFNGKNPEKSYENLRAV